MRRLSRLSKDEEGLAGFVLVIIIAWALSAVLMLTGTLVAAQQIDNRVELITEEVGPIDQDLDSVALVEETNRLASEILDAAQPLSGQLEQVEAAADSIDGTVVAILDTAGQINTTAKSINGNVQDINGTVVALDGTVDGIHGNVRGIHATARSINDGVAAINGRADVIIVLVRGIKADTGNVLAQVGQNDGSLSNSTIRGHAHSIDCSPAVRGQAC